MSPSYDELNAAEREWVASHVASARSLADEFVPGCDVLDPAALDRVWAAWLAGSPTADRANDVVHAVGLAFGQWLVDHDGFDWRLVTDQHGTEIGVHSDPGDVVLLPANLVAKRWETRRTGFLEPLREEALHARDLASRQPPPHRKRFGLF